MIHVYGRHYIGTTPRRESSGVSTTVDAPARGFIARGLAWLKRQLVADCSTHPVECECEACETPRMFIESSRGDFVYPVLCGKCGRPRVTECVCDALD